MRTKKNTQRKKNSTHTRSHLNVNSKNKSDFVQRMLFLCSFVIRFGFCWGFGYSFFCALFQHIMQNETNKQENAEKNKFITHFRMHA